MTSTQIETFSAEHLAGAAAVLSARHTDHLAQSPLLAPGDARAALKDFWDKKGRSGAVAIRGGRVVGFVLAEIMAHPLFGDCAWVAHPGHAADDGELLRDLYSAAAEVWVESGADRHYVLVPAFARALEPWYRLGFGHMHLEARRPISMERATALAGMTLRRGRRAIWRTPRRSIWRSGSPPHNTQGKWLAGGAPAPSIGRRTNPSQSTL